MNIFTTEFVIRVIVCAVIIYVVWTLYEKIGKKKS